MSEWVMEKNQEFPDDPAREAASYAEDQANSYHCIVCGEAHDNDEDEDLCRGCANLDCCATCEHYDRDQHVCDYPVPAWVVVCDGNICDPEDGSGCDCWEPR